MSDLKQHYSQVLGLGDDWEVSEVKLEMESNRVVIDLVHVGGLCCPECDAACSQADQAPQRQWRHLDMMQFETVLRARTPRSNCKSCGVKTVTIPWSGKSSRFTLMFEAFAIEVLKAVSSVSHGSKLLRLSWNTAHQLMARAVDRGMSKRKSDPIKSIGIDEKSFGKGQDYISTMVDLEGSRVMEVSKDRSEASCDKLTLDVTKEVFSRAYFKLKEALMWSGIKIKPTDVCALGFAGGCCIGGIVFVPG